MLKYPASPYVIRKILSRNDTGETGGHQAGILVPKDQRILSFFPELGISTKNPRVHLQFIDGYNHAWIFVYIYYNNRLFGGTRNEFRLTRMTRYIQENDLTVGDEIIIYKENDDTRRINFKRSNAEPIINNGILRLRGDWKIISYP